MKKTALITGASSGIGLELSRILAKNDHHLILVDINIKALESLKTELSILHPGLKVHTLHQDLSLPEAALEVFRKAEEYQPGIDILINNAGFGTIGPFVDADWERLSRMLNLHNLTLTHLTRLFLPAMVEKGWGKIMNVASVAGFQPSPLMAVYNASKAYVLSFSEAIANELEGTGVTVTVLCPGLTKTGFQAVTGGGRAGLTENKWISSSAKEVAQYAYKAMNRGQVVAIPGTINYFLANAHRFLPRKIVTRLVRKAQEKNRNLNS